MQWHDGDRTKRRLRVGRRRGGSVILARSSAIKQTITSTELLLQLVTSPSLQSLHAPVPFHNQLETTIQRAPTTTEMREVVGSFEAYHLKTNEFLYFFVAWKEVVL